MFWRDGIRMAQTATATTLAKVSRSTVLSPKEGVSVIAVRKRALLPRCRSTIL